MVLIDLKCISGSVSPEISVSVPVSESSGVFWFRSGSGIRTQIGSGSGQNFGSGDNI